ncbi:hypothetical protein RGQ29_010527 [Quercus rubra]|uniref:Pectinesterase inhibitor domain-containing protein n=1 Tax=Quercus rubra TaxID=3512 RepID=A0AAN7G2S4_QUERU|nr:hypothetical protein RGQ29_010527 [Quercus rubra]
MVPSSSFLLLFLSSLPYLLHHFSLVASDQDLILKTCQSTQYPELCISTINSDPLSNTSITKEESASNTSLYLLNLQFKNGVNPVFQRMVRLCSDMYANASKAFDESRKALRIYQYNLARLEVNAAKLYPKDCWDALRGTTGLTYPAMLVKREELVEHLCDVISGILNVLFRF